MSRVGSSHLSIASEYDKAGNAILRARIWIFSIDLDCSLVRLVCHTGEAYSKIGRMVAVNMRTMSIGLSPDLLRSTSEYIRVAAFETIKSTCSAHVRSCDIINPRSFDELTRSITVLSTIRGSGSIECLKFTMISFVFDALIFILLDLDHSQIRSTDNWIEVDWSVHASYTVVVDKLIGREFKAKIVYHDEK